MLRGIEWSAIYIQWAHHEAWMAEFVALRRLIPSLPETIVLRIIVLVTCRRYRDFWG